MKKFIEFLSSLLFPIQCVGCRAADQWLCARCAQPVRLNSFEPVRFRPSGSQLTIKVLVAADYSQPLLQRLLSTYKYRFVVDLGDRLGDLLVDFLKTAKGLPAIDLVAPVPLASRRLRWRSFNQSEILARRVGQAFSWPVDPGLLVRHHYRHPQVGLDAQRRRQNVRHAFRVADPASVRGKRVLLVDDVVTTGSTLTECAAGLWAAGAREVWGLVIAHG